MSRAVLTALALVWAGCVLDPFGASARGLRSARDAARAGDVFAARESLREAEELADGDPELVREVRMTALEVERVLVARSARELVVAGDTATIANGWALRLRNARAKGPADVDALLATKMTHAFGLLLDSTEAAVAAGQGAKAIAPLVGLARFPGVDNRINVDQRIAALATVAARIHLDRAAAAAAYPLTARGHFGLAARYLGGTLPSAQPLVAPMLVSVAVTANASAACRAAVDEVSTRFARQGGDRRVEIHLDLAECSTNEETSTKTETVTWSENVPYETTETTSVQECRIVDRTTTTQRCSVLEPLPSGWGGKVSCGPVTTTQSATVCESRPVTGPVVRYRLEPRSGTRAVTRYRSAAAIRGAYVVRRTGQVDRRGEIRIAVASDDLTYPAVGTLGARDRDAKTTVPYLATTAHEQLASLIRAPLHAALDTDLAAARAAIADAAARGERDREEDAQMRLVLLGDDETGVLGTRYGVSANEVRAAFAATSFPGLAASRGAAEALPSPDVVPELTDTDRAEVARRRRTGLAPPLVARGNFTFGIGGFSTDSVIAPGTDADLLGFAGLGMTLRGGASVLGRWRGGNAGLVLADEAAVRVDAGFALSRAEDQFDGGTLLRLGAEYTLAGGLRGHRRGGVLVGARAIASYEVLEGVTFASVPLFGRIEVPLPTGSVTFEAFGAPIAGAPLVGGAIYLTAQTLRRSDPTSRFFALRAERARTDRTASFTTSTFDEMTASFTGVSATYITFELGGAF